MPTPNVVIMINKETNDSELWVDDKFQASWNAIDISNKDMYIVIRMLETAIEVGAELKLKEIRTMLGVN